MASAERRFLCSSVSGPIIISREINFIGNLVGSHNDLDELMTLTAQRRVGLHTSVHPLEAVNDAMADLDNGRLQGRGILVPAA